MKLDSNTENDRCIRARRHKIEIQVACPDVKRRGLDLMLKVGSGSDVKTRGLNQTYKYGARSNFKEELSQNLKFNMEGLTQMLKVGDCQTLKLWG